MKKIMKNKLFHVVVPFLMMMLVLATPNMSAKAATDDISSVETSVTNKTVTVSGKTDSSKEVYAVSIAVYDSKDALYALYSTDVNADHEYKATFTLEEGTFLIKVVNYEGGNFKESSVTIKEKEAEKETEKKEQKIEATGAGNAVLTDESGIIPSGATMKSTKVESGEVFNKVTELVKKLDTVINNTDAKSAIFELDLADKNGTAIHELSGKVSVTIDAPFTVKAGYTIKVYRLDSDKLVACDTVLKDGKVTFTTDHFSTYVFVEEKDVKAAKTGDSIPWIPFVALVAGMGLIMAGFKGRKTNE